MPCVWATGRPIIDHYLRKTLAVAAIQDLKPEELNNLYDMLEWVPEAGSEAEETRDKRNLVSWIQRNMSDLKDSSRRMPTQALIQESMALRGVRSPQPARKATSAPHVVTTHAPAPRRAPSLPASVPSAPTKLMRSHPFARASSMPVDGTASVASVLPGQDTIRRKAPRVSTSRWSILLDEDSDDDPVAAANELDEAEFSDGSFSGSDFPAIRSRETASAERKILEGCDDDATIPDDEFGLGDSEASTIIHGPAHATSFCDDEDLMSFAPLLATQATGPTQSAAPASPPTTSTGPIPPTDGGLKAIGSEFLRYVYEHDAYDEAVTVLADTLMVTMSIKKAKAGVRADQVG